MALIDPVQGQMRNKAYPAKRRKKPGNILPQVGNEYTILLGGLQAGGRLVFRIFS